MSNLEFRRFICRACGLIYDEAKGDEDSGLAPGTRFEDIPDEWACPLCGVTKADFEPCDAQPVPVRAATAWAGCPARSTQGSGARRLHRQGGLVVVGGGTAAWTLVEQVRALDPQRAITMVSACSADRYDKPRLSVACKQGVAVEQLVRERGVDAAARLNVTLMAHTHAFDADPSARRLRTTRGTLAYEELVLAHGSAPRDCKGLPREFTWRINDLSAYAGLRAALGSDPRHVLIVGAGLVGCELANDLAQAGHHVSLLDVSDRPLSIACPDQSAALLRAWKALPIGFLGGVRVQTAQRKQTMGVTLTLQDGRELQGDLLVSAVGLQTPSALANSLGLQWNDGIALDPHTLLTNVPHVHALGDCISLNGRAQRYIEPIHRQACVLAARLCGARVPVYEPAPPVVRVKTSSMPLTLTAA